MHANAAEKADTPRGHLTEAAYQYVKHRILTGIVKPGQRLDVNEIVETLTASRQPVMTALRRLATEGFVDIAPQSSCRVRIPDRAEAVDFFRAFAAVEGVLAEIAAERSAPDLLQNVIAINAKIGELEKRAKLSGTARGEAYWHLNREFHRGIHCLSNSVLISSLSESFWDRADFYISSTVGLTPFATRIGPSFKEHTAILTAIRERRSADARRLMEEHIRAFARDSQV